METLLDKKGNAKEIVVAWLELAKAYGSVAHNLIQYALEWYHVPTNIRELIYYYYDELFVRIKTKPEVGMVHVPDRTVWMLSTVSSPFSW